MKISEIVQLIFSEALEKNTVFVTPEPKNRLRFEAGSSSAGKRSRLWRRKMRRTL